MIKKSQFKRLDSLLGSFESNKSYQKNHHSKKQSVYSDDAFDFLSLIKSWETIVGEKLAAVTIPLKNQRGTLIVLSNHPQYSQQLSFMQNIIIEKIVSHFPKLNNKIKNIKFQVNESFFNEKKTQYQKIITQPVEEMNSFHPQSPEYKKYKKEAEEIYKDINDINMKEQLVSIYLQLKANE